MATMNGTIKRLVGNKGSGFVLAEDGTCTLFHQSACADGRFNLLTQKTGTHVREGQGPRARAENIRLS